MLIGNTETHAGMNARCQGMSHPLGSVFLLSCAPHTERTIISSFSIFKNNKQPFTACTQCATTVDNDASATRPPAASPPIQLLRLSHAHTRAHARTLAEEIEENKANSRASSILLHPIMNINMRTATRTQERLSLSLSSECFMSFPPPSPLRCECWC